jgi:hypothetical protein
VANRLQYKPSEDYAVRTQWPLDLFLKKKIDTSQAIQCMAFYRCLTPPAEAMVRRSASVLVNQTRKDWAEARLKRLLSQQQDFKKYAVAEEFKAQFETEKLRYKFMIVHGPSEKGKSQLVLSWFKNPYVMKDGISWNDYQPETHDAIVFEDCRNMNEYICNHKTMFQSSSVVKVNLSKTNIYEQQVDTIEKPIVIMVNELPEYLDPWVVHNSYMLHIDAPTWGMSALEDAPPMKKIKTSDDSTSSDPMRDKAEPGPQHPPRLQGGPPLCQKNNALVLDSHSCKK